MAEVAPILTFPDIDPDQMKENASKAAKLLKCLANESRLTLLCTLASGERSVGELHGASMLSQSSLSQHLGVLRKEGLVQTRRESQTIYYSLADSPALHVIGTLHDIYCGTGSSQQTEP